MTRYLVSPFAVLLLSTLAFGQNVPIREVAGQPLGANATRLTQALEYLGQPLDATTAKKIRSAAQERNSALIQQILDPNVLFVVSLNPEVRVKVARGPAKARLTQAGYTCHLVKVINDSTVTRELRIMSPQSGPVYSGAAEAILKRQAQTELRENENVEGKTDRFLEVEMFHSQPMNRRLSGLEVEYAIAMIYCSESGQLEATVGFDVGAGTQDIGFRGEVPVLFNVEPAVPIKLRILDEDGEPTTARLTFRDKQARVYPPQTKRLSPDFFFQPQIYRESGETVLLPKSELELISNRGPEYWNKTQTVDLRMPHPQPITVQLQRWVNPLDYGFFCGDHHIHGAGCSHYDNPTKGVTPAAMFSQVKGEGLNVGCVLTWGPCFDFQRQYFSPIADTVSEELHLLKYDLEISGFGSAALGHVCLLRLRDQTYPGSEGTKTKGWPTWTVPVMRWAKSQGGVTGYPHSAMRVNPQALANRTLNEYDTNKDGFLDGLEADKALLPTEFHSCDVDGDGQLNANDLRQTIDNAANELPNLCVPEMNGAGAMEICVSTAEGVCDFISAMDTERIPEWNTWYHIMNCGFPLKLSGETDFPCMSSRRVGQGRVYVQLGSAKNFTFDNWCTGLERGQSYVSDGFAHALNFQVNGAKPGTEDVHLQEPATVAVNATVAFAPEQPNAVAYGGITPQGGRRVIGDTVHLRAPRESGIQKGGQRLIEIVVNGEVAYQQKIVADGKTHEITADIPIKESSWVALRQFPQLHTNPVNVIVDDRPIRASAKSARWCIETIKLLWTNRQRFISVDERPAAKATYDRAIKIYERIAEECDPDT